MTALAAVLALACLVVAAFHVLRLLQLSRGDAAGEATHTAMALGMAAMLSPLGDPVPAAVWIGVFILCGAWFAAAALRSEGGPARADAVHQVLGSGAMLFMLLAHDPGGAEAGGLHAGHLVHDGGSNGAHGLSSIIAIVLAGYFAWRVLQIVSHPIRSAASAPAVVDGSVATRSRLRLLADPGAVAAAHAITAVAMTVMLLSTA